MRTNKLVLLLKTLDQIEARQLDRFLCSPYFNQESVLYDLFQILMEYFPDFADDLPTKEELFQRLYPGHSYDDKQMRYLFSRLNKQAEQFLAFQQIESDPFQLSLALLEAHSVRGLEKGYRQIEKKINGQFDQTQAASGDLFLAKFQWAEIKERHFNRQRLRKYNQNLQSAADHLDQYYFLHRLRIACAMLDRQAILQSQYEHNLSPQWITHLEQHAFFRAPVIQLYYTIYQALADEQEEAYFEKLKQGIQELSGKISLSDCRDIYLFAINYCARKIRQGESKFVGEALNLYRSGITNGIFIEDGVLSPWTFTNVVKLSLRKKEYLAIEEFITTYAPLLPDDFRENALHYNLAELYYYTGRFEEAQQELLQVAYSDLNYYLGARVLLAKIYYETDTEEPLLALLASFIMFLRRNKELSQNLKHTYLNFCQLLFQIIRQPASKLEKVHAKILSTELLTDRSWLEKSCLEAMQ